MFSKKQRLTTELFNKVFSSGKIKKTDFFLIKYSNNNLSYPRFAVVISKKNIKLAVKRNSVRRRFLIALEKSYFKDEKKDFIFILNKNIEKKNLEEIILTINKIELE